MLPNKPSPSEPEISFLHLYEYGVSTRAEVEELMAGPLSIELAPYRREYGELPSAMQNLVSWDRIAKAMISRRSQMEEMSEKGYKLTRIADLPGFSCGNFTVEFNDEKGGSHYFYVPKK